MHNHEIKLGRTNQTSNETYLGLTDEDFASTPNRRYAASQQDVFYGVHEQYQARYFAGLSPNIDLTVTAYRNSFARNWYKLQSIQGVGISSVLGDPTRYAEELRIAKGAESAAGALRVRANNREYYSTGVGSVLGLRLRRGNVAQRFEIGLRYHEDQEDRLQHEDGFGMRDGRMVFTSAGAAGSQSNRISDAEAWAFFIEDKVEWGRWTVTPGFRYERIELIRTDYHTNDPGRTAPSRVRRNELDVFVPGIGVTFDVSAEFTVLGGLNRGFAPPGPGSTADTKAEESINYEGGFRWHRAFEQVQLVGFFDDYSNLLGRDTLSTGGDGTGDLFNGGAARVFGIEASARFNLLAKLDWSFRLPLLVSYTFTDAEFRSDFQSQFGPWGSVSRGDAVPYLPSHNLNVGITVEESRWVLDLSSSYMGRMRVRAGSGPIAPHDATDARLLLNLTGEYHLAEGVRLFAGIQNLTNKSYIASRRPAGARPGLPRTVAAGLKFDVGR